MANISNTEVDATRQALIASIVQMTLKQQSVLVPTVTDYSSFAVPGAKSVGAPRRTQFAAADKTEETDLTGQTFTFSADTINLDKHKAIYTLLEKISGVQANVNVEALQAANIPLVLPTPMPRESGMVAVEQEPQIIDGVWKQVWTLEPAPEPEEN